MAAWRRLAMCLAAGLIAARAEAGFIFPDVEYITLPAPNAYPLDIATGPLGDVWVTLNGSGRIGRIGPEVMVDEFPIPTDFASYPTTITAGPDGNMWFIDDGARSIGRITPAGIVTQFPAPSEVNDPYDITSGPDGRLWFTERTFGRGVVNDGFVASITRSTARSTRPASRRPPSTSPAARTTRCGSPPAASADSASTASIASFPPRTW